MPIDHLTIAAIIPARGGSKGIPHKNIQLLAGKPLIVYSIEQAQRARYLGRVFVSTDDEQIAQISIDAGGEVINRPAELAVDQASSESALLHALSTWRSQGYDPDIVVFLQCTSPIRTALDIDAAVNQLVRNEADSLLSVVPSHRFVWTKKPDGSPQSVNFDYRHRQRRQDMPAQYVENGSIYMFKPWVLEQEKNRLGGKMDLYIMPEESTFDIDVPLDFELVEFIMRTRGYLT